MPCKVCGSVKQREFPSELNIHPPRGLENWHKPSVWAFPLLFRCMDCDFTELTLQQVELRSVRENDDGDGSLDAADLARRHQNG